MGKPSLGLITGLLVLIANGAAHAASQTRCLARNERESQVAYDARVRQSCEADWNSTTPRRGAVGAEHDAFVKRCAKPCVALLDAAVPTSALWLAGLALAAAGGAAAAASKSSAPASP